MVTVVLVRSAANGMAANSPVDAGGGSGQRIAVIKS
jgi:hypothetical protein